MLSLFIHSSNQAASKPAHTLPPHCSTPPTQASPTPYLASLQIRRRLTQTLLKILHTLLRPKNNPATPLTPITLATVSLHHHLLNYRFMDTLLLCYFCDSEVLIQQPWKELLSYTSPVPSLFTVFMRQEFQTRDKSYTMNFELG